MAPRRRPPAVKKNSRMAAAVENMTPFGFEESLVISTVKELLKVYTEDGWYFIEENYYSVLRDTLLQKTASPPQEEEQEPSLLLQQEGGGDHGIVMAESSAGSSSMPAAIENQKNTNTKGAEYQSEGEVPSSPPPPQLEHYPELQLIKPYYGRISRDEAANCDILQLSTMPLDVIKKRWSFLPRRK